MDVGWQIEIHDIRRYASRRVFLVDALRVGDFPRRLGLQSESMQACVELFLECLIDQAMSLHLGLPLLVQSSRRSSFEKGDGDLQVLRTCRRQL